MALNLVMIGPPGAGKGTQAIRVCRQYGIPKVSTGDILRTIARTDTDLGREVARVQKAGDLVSDGVLADVVRNFSSEGFLSGLTSWCDTDLPSVSAAG